MRALTILAVAASALAHGPSHDISCDANACPLAIEPAWVQYFSTAAAGPEQLWINYGASPDAMTIQWLTADMTAGTVVQYGTSSGSYPSSSSGNATFYKYSAKYTSGLIHRVHLTGLALNTTYFYRVGDSSAWSAEYSFKSNPGLGAFYPYTIGFVADIGESSDAMSTVAHVVSGLSEVNEMIIVGDLSYASGCEATGCGVWDAFQRMMQPIAAVKPFSISIGNHETYDTANGIVAISTQYRLGYGMPAGGRTDGAMYFSYEAGPAHFISMCSFIDGGFGPDQPISKWLAADLASVDRTRTPWLFVLVHAPPYNSNTEHQGDGEPLRAAYEAQFTAAKVSAGFAGHVHAYERSHPVVNNGKVMPDGQGTVWLNIGDAGAALYTSWLPTPSWSAVHSAVFGHGQLQIVNSSAALWTWHRNQDNEKIVADSTTIVNWGF